MAEKHSNTTITYKPILGFEDYRAGEDGSIWSKKKRTLPGEVRDGEWRRLKPIADACGYFRITLSNGGRSATFLIHQLILVAFVGPCPEGQECCHENGIHTDNRIDNLRWDSHANNMADKTRHEMSAAKLTASTVCEIRQRYAAGGVSQSELAVEFGVTTSAISSATSGRNWRHVTVSLIPARAMAIQNCHRKLTEDNVRDIRKRFASGGVTKAQLARDFSVSSTVIVRIVRRDIWKHVE